LAQRKPIALGYARKSLTRDEVESDRYSAERQTNSVQGWCAANGYELVEIFVDSEGRRSGRTAKRPGWQALQTGPWALQLPLPLFESGLLEAA